MDDDPLRRGDAVQPHGDARQSCQPRADHALELQRPLQRSVHALRQQEARRLFPPAHRRAGLAHRPRVRYAERVMRDGYRGYIASRPVNGVPYPHKVQNLVIRDYAARKKLPFLLSATEIAVPDSTMMLNDLLAK